MDFIWILFAFLFGLLSKGLGMPPLLGYLVAGFALNALGFVPEQSLKTLAELGITLMLFTIGLKLDVRSLSRNEILINTSANMLLWTVLTIIASWALAFIGVGYYLELGLTGTALVAFALSFSSTVCIIKILEESGEIKTRHGNIAVGILVLQDVVAVVFLVAATGITPSPWASFLPLLYFIRRPLGRLLVLSGHGELLTLTGILLALGGYELFNMVDVKGDLGALVFGMLLSKHDKANELAKSLLSIKDMFLIGFFLTIGFTALPNLDMLVAALLLSLALPVKFLLFFALGLLLRLRARTAFLSSLALANFSEFGLIVAAICVEAGWLNKEWLVILALAVSFSFILTSVLYPRVHSLYGRYKAYIQPLEHPVRLKYDRFEQPGDADILVVGMGRVGSSACRALHQRMGSKVCGVDADFRKVKQQKREGLHVIQGDAEDADFWENLDTHNIRLIMLAMPYIDDCKNITEQLNERGYTGMIAAIARYEDEVQELQEFGIHRVFNYFAETGAGFADESLQLIEQDQQPSFPFGR